MSILLSTEFRNYAFGLACTALGAWLTDVTDSLLPLAFGGSVLVLNTVPLVKAIWSRKRIRRDAP